MQIEYGGKILKVKDDWNYREKIAALVANTKNFIRRWIFPKPSWN